MLVEQHDDARIVRLHPLRQRAAFHAPAADEAHARVHRTIGVVVAAAAGAVRARAAGVHRGAHDLDLQPAVAARRARLAFTGRGWFCHGLL